jgi:hypothetical protein
VLRRTKNGVFECVRDKIGANIITFPIFHTVKPDLHSLVSITLR